MEEYFLPGFRFYPTEEELASFYLPNKLSGRREDLNHIMDMVIPVLRIYDFHPWDLPQLAGVVCRGDPEQWFFFVPIQESEARGGRPNRLTSSGYWKATGSPGFVYSSNNRIIAEKKTMVFYRGRAPTGTKTNWKMNEYKAIDHRQAASSTTAPPMARQEFSLCRVYKKSKSLRAFDRRPPPGVVIGQPSAATQEGHDFDATTCRRDRPLRVEMTSSPDMSTSSSGYLGGLPSQAAAGENDESMWDLEEFAGLVLGDELEQLNA